MKKAESSCETMCLTQDGLGIFLLTQPLPEDSEKRSCRAIRTEDGASLYCTGTQSGDFTSTFQEGFRVVNSDRGNENHPAPLVTDTAGLAGDRLVPRVDVSLLGGWLRGTPWGTGSGAGSRWWGGGTCSRRSFGGCCRWWSPSCYSASLCFPLAEAQNISKPCASLW